MGQSMARQMVNLPPPVLIWLLVPTHYHIFHFWLLVFKDSTKPVHEFLNAVGGAGGGYLHWVL